MPHGPGMFIADVLALNGGGPGGRRLESAVSRTPMAEQYDDADGYSACFSMQKASAVGTRACRPLRCWRAPATLKVISRQRCCCCRTLGPHDWPVTAPPCRHS